MSARQVKHVASIIIAVLAVVLIIVKIQAGSSYVPPEQDTSWFKLSEVDVAIPEMSSDRTEDYLVYYIVPPSSCVGCLLEIEQFDSLFSAFDFGGLTIRSEAMIVVDSSASRAARFIALAQMKLDAIPMSFSSIEDEFRLPVEAMGPRAMIIIDRERRKIVWQNELRENAVSPLELKLEFAMLLRGQLNSLRSRG